jgi:hypothetical protein
VTTGSPEPAIAFATRTFEPPGLEIRVNFGMYAGREATPAEIEDLAAVLRDKVHELAIVSEDRHQFGDHSEAEIHQVRIEVPTEALPARKDEVVELRGRVLEAAERWAEACIEDRHIDVTNEP